MCTSFYEALLSVRVPLEAFNGCWCAAELLIDGRIVRSNHGIVTAFEHRHPLTCDHQFPQIFCYVHCDWKKGFWTYKLLYLVSI